MYVDMLQAERENVKMARLRLDNTVHREEDQTRLKTAVVIVSCDEQTMTR